MSERELAEKVRRACVEAAIEGYDYARMSGLCQQGAWDVALDRMRSLDIDRVLAEAGQSPSADQNSMRRPSGSKT